MNTVSKLIYLKNDIVTYMNFIYVTIYHFSSIVISLLFIYHFQVYQFTYSVHKNIFHSVVTSTFLSSTVWFGQLK